MRDLINKLTLLESNGNNLPKIALKINNHGWQIEFEFSKSFSPEILNINKTFTNKKAPGVLEKTVNIKLINVRLNIYTKPNKHGKLEPYIDFRGNQQFSDSGGFITIVTQPKLQYNDLDGFIGYDFIFDIANKISQFIGFEKNIFEIDEIVVTSSGEISASIDITDDGLKIIDDAYQWHQEHIGDL